MSRYKISTITLHQKDAWELRDLWHNVVLITMPCDEVEEDYFRNTMAPNIQDLYERSQKRG
jgi:hypothetical protein